MGKKNRGKDEWTGDEPETPFNNPFAALSDGDPPRVAKKKPKKKPSKPEPMPTPGRAVVRKERKGRGGKTVTVVSHLDLKPDHLEEMSSRLRKRLGVGGAVEDDTVVLQGDQRDRVRDLLEDMGITNISVS